MKRLLSTVIAVCVLLLTLFVFSAVDTYMVLRRERARRLTTSNRSFT